MRCIGNKIYPTQNDKNNYIGVELEFVSRISFDEWRRLLNKFIVQKKVSVGYDASVQCLLHGPYVGCACFSTEIRVIDKEDNIFKTIREVTTIINNNGGKVNKTCGLHVHLDMRNRTNPELIYKNLVRSQNILRRKVTEDRFNNEFCRPQHTDVLLLADRNKYKAVNVYNFFTQTNKKIFEIRLHHGTLNYKIINRWLMLLLKITRCKKTISITDSVANFKKQLKLNKTLVEYLRQRNVR